MNRCFGTLLVVLVAMLGSGCPELQAPRPRPARAPQTTNGGAAAPAQTRDLPVVSLDDLRFVIASAGQPMTIATTSAQRTEATAQAAAEVATFLQGKRIQFIIRVRDIRVQGPRSADIYFSLVEIGSVPSTRWGFQEQLNGKIQLGILAENARRINAGQRMRVWGTAGVQVVGSSPLASMHPRNLLMYTYERTVGRPMYCDFMIIFQPTQYAILEEQSGFTSN